MLIGLRIVYLLYDKVWVMKIIRKLKFVSVVIFNFMRFFVVYVFILRNFCIIKIFLGFGCLWKKMLKNLLEIFFFSRYFMMY